MAVTLRNTLDFLKHNKLITFLIFLSLLSMLRNLFLPLSSDELTYANIAENIMLRGEYALGEKPSTITPSLPFQIAFFFTKEYPLFGFVMAKLFNLLLLFVGFRYLFLFLKRIQLSFEVICSIILLTIVNTNFVLWSLRLYPETILFCSFWIFIYYLTREINKPKDILLILLPFVVLILTRYVFAVFGILVVYVIFNHFKNQLRYGNYQIIYKSILYSVICLLPVLFWFKYVLYLESDIDIGLSYFNRFKDNDIFYNLKAGIGLIKHDEVDNINGIPAFITLFLPITGFRNWILSILLIITFCSGYLWNFKKDNLRILFIAILMVMLGLVFAGTGFSRYWLPMLPGFLLGFYLFFKTLKLKDSQFIILAQIAAVIYVVNELRLDVKILNDYL